MSESSILTNLQKELIVSCQALENEPLHGSETMAKMAQAAKAGGAKGIRCNTVSDVTAIKKQTALPVIALIKREYRDSDIYITPTIKEIKELLSVKPDIIALDATTRLRPNGEQLSDIVRFVHENSEALVMGDIATLKDARHALNCNVDMISTTLSGYTKETEHVKGPDFALIEQLCQIYTIPVIAEGRIQTPEQAKKMLELGAWAVVVGSAITRPQLITQSFVSKMSRSEVS